MVEVTYYTDPACPWSWAAEPHVRRILVEFATEVQFTYVMGGMAEELCDPEHKLTSSLGASAESGMPVDPRVWERCPPGSTYPACRAVKAAERQGLAEPVLRTIRERVMLERETIDTGAALVAIAADVAGLDLGRFTADLDSAEVAAAFDADLRRTRGVPEAAKAKGKDRPSFPTFEIGDGFCDEEGLRGAVLAAGAGPGPLPCISEAFLRFERLAAAEVAEVCGLGHDRAQSELWALAESGAVTAARILGSALFTRAR